MHFNILGKDDKTWLASCRMNNDGNHVSQMGMSLGEIWPKQSTLSPLCSLTNGVEHVLLSMWTKKKPAMWLMVILSTLSRQMKLPILQRQD